MNCMSDEVFFDTNIIVYAYDASEPMKQKICARLLERVYEKEIIGIVSNQILGEVFKALTENIENPISIENAEVIVGSIVESENWIKINYDHDTVKKAILTVKLNNVPFWDTLIAETMRENGFVKIYTENEKDFKKIPNMRVINPLQK